MKKCDNKIQARN